MKIKFCVLPICLWNVLLVLASSPEVVKRSAENFDSRFQGNFDGPKDHYHSHRYQYHYHPVPHPVSYSIYPPSPPLHHFPPRPNNHNTPEKYEAYPWQRPEFKPPGDYHHPEQSFGEPTWDRNPWNDPSEKWPSSTDSPPATIGYTYFDKETKDSQDELLPDCHCKFENVGSRTIVTVSVKTITTPPSTTSTSATTPTTPSSSSTSSTTEFDWNTYAEKELAEDLGKNNTAGIGLIDVRLKEI